MIHSSPDDAVAAEYFSQANGTAAILLLSLGYTSLQFTHPKPFAIAAIVVSVLWLFSVGGPYRAIRKRYLPDHAPIVRYLAVAWHLKVFLLSLAFIMAIAGGMTVNDIYSCFGYPISNQG
ncbi:hypothetical protein EI533_25325 [Pseudomonas donghuensis]|nr:hypothetical protein [Pseudomonas donghuensis]